jgi:hypothetical protein
MTFRFERSAVRAGRALVPLLSFSSALVSACSERLPSPDPERVGSTEAPIEGGRQVNDPVNPISVEFAASTVLVRTSFGTADAYSDERCTGVFIATNKILTAAHCVYRGPEKSNPLGPSQVSFYPVGAGLGAKPNEWPDLTLAAAAIVQPGIASCSMTNADCYTSGGHFADLAILTLAMGRANTYKPVWLGPREGSFANLALWAVGTGFMNWLSNKADASNDSFLMEWVPMYSVKPGSDPGTIATGSLIADYGDSGGPIYAYDWTNHRLILFGISSYILNDAGARSNVYTSVIQGDNYDWLVQQGATVRPADAGSPISPTATFGAAL